VDESGVYEYEPGRHALHPTLASDLRAKLQAAALDQPCVGEAPLCLVISIDVGRTASKYGGRAERYCLLEAGHVAQNVLLQATALGLAGVPVGAFEDQRIAALLELPPNLRPVYLVPLGYPQGE
jgi:SagB-type dehydrogenase family enzyme